MIPWKSVIVVGLFLLCMYKKVTCTSMQRYTIHNKTISMQNYLGDSLYPIT